MIPSKREQTLLKELSNDPIWTGMLDKIESDCAIKPWKPGSEVSEEEKKSRWINESGIQKGVSRILEILRLGE